MCSVTCFSLFWLSILFLFLPSVDPSSFKMFGLSSKVGNLNYNGIYTYDWDPLDDKVEECLYKAIRSYAWYPNGAAHMYGQPNISSNVTPLAYRITQNGKFDVPQVEVASSKFHNYNVTLIPKNLTLHCFHTSWTNDSSLSFNDKHGNIVWIVGVVICVLLISTVMATLLVMGNRRIRKAAKQNVCMSEDFAREALPKKLSYLELALATNNFSSGIMLGEGGTGAVYKGYLSNSNHVVAVKKIYIGYSHAKEVFTTELKIISQLKCSNIVPLIGWSNDHGEFLLVYDYMSNGSLDKHLFKNGTHLPWKVRCGIALDLAFALLYLHEESGKCILHRDIKSANVMLDSNFSAKLGDFGVAMFLDPQLGLQTTKVVGTFGYIAPEYYYQGKASKESDIYSFGVVALEVATGRRKHKESHLSLVESVWELYGAGKIIVAADQRLMMDFDAREMECLLIVGLWCAHPIDNQRPSARQAIQVLKFEAPLPDLPNEMPSLINNVTPSPIPSDPPSISLSLEFGR